MFTILLPDGRYESLTERKYVITILFNADIFIHRIGSLRPCVCKAGVNKPSFKKSLRRVVGTPFNIKENNLTLFHLRL